MEFGCFVFGRCGLHDHEYAHMCCSTAVCALLCMWWCERAVQGVVYIFRQLMHYGGCRWDRLNVNCWYVGGFRANLTEAFCISIASPFQIGLSKTSSMFYSATDIDHILCIHTKSILHTKSKHFDMFMILDWNMLHENVGIHLLKLCKSVYFCSFSAAGFWCVNVMQ